MTHIRSYVMYELYLLRKSFVDTVRKLRFWWYIYLVLFVFAVLLGEYLIALVSFVFMVCVSLYRRYVSGYDIYWARKKMRLEVIEVERQQDNSGG